MNKAREERWKERNKQRALRRQEERLPKSTLEEYDDELWEINTYTKDNHIEDVYDAHVILDVCGGKIFNMRNMKAYVEDGKVAATEFRFNFNGAMPSWMFSMSSDCLHGINDLRKLRKVLLKNKAKIMIDESIVAPICDCFPLFFSGMEFCDGIEN